MKLAILNITGGDLSGGYQKYLQEIIPLLAQDTCLQNLYMVVPPRFKSSFKDLGVSGKLELGSWPVLHALSGFPRLGRQLQQMDVDVVFVPAPRYFNCNWVPTVVMVQNMEPLVIPWGGNTLKEGIKNLIRAYWARRACQHATRIIAVSHYVREFLTNRWHIPPQKIGVVYHGVEGPPAAAESVRPGVLDEVGASPFIFTAGSIRPARGLEDLIQALAILREHGMCYTLLIAGELNPETHSYKRRIECLAKDCGVASQVLWAGWLSRLEMSWCFYDCLAFVMTSRAEACPNIVLEAMAHGCVCVSTETPPMPEFFVDVAAYYPPKNWKVLGETLIKVLSWDDNKRQAMSERARQRASQFSWDECAEKTVQQLQLAIEHFARRNRGS